MVFNNTCEINLYVLTTNNFFILIEYRTLSIYLVDTYRTNGDELV